MKDILLAWAQLKGKKKEIGVVTEDHTNFLFYMTYILDNSSAHQGRKVLAVSEGMELELEVGDLKLKNKNINIQNKENNINVIDYVEVSPVVVEKVEKDIDTKDIILMVKNEIMSVDDNKNSNVAIENSDILTEILESSNKEEGKDIFDDEVDIQLQLIKSESSASSMDKLEKSENNQPSVSSANAPKPMYNTHIHEGHGEGVLPHTTIPLSPLIDPALLNNETLLPDYEAVAYKGSSASVKMFDMHGKSMDSYLASVSSDMKLEDIDINQIHVDFSHPNVSALYYQGYSEDSIKQAYHIFKLQKASEYKSANEDWVTFVEEMLQIMEFYDIEHEDTAGHRNQFDILWQNFICFFCCKLFYQCYQKRSFVLFISFFIYFHVQKQEKREVKRLLE